MRVKDFNSDSDSDSEELERGNATTPAKESQIVPETPSSPIRSAAAGPRLSILDNRYELFVNRTTVKNAASNSHENHYKLLLHMIVSPTILAFLVIIVPLAGLNPSYSQLHYLDTNSVTKLPETHALIHPWVMLLIC